PPAVNPGVGVGLTATPVLRGGGAEPADADEHLRRPPALVPIARQPRRLRRPAAGRDGGGDPGPVLRRVPPQRAAVRHRNGADADPLGAGRLRVRTAAVPRSTGGPAG